VTAKPLPVPTPETQLFWDKAADHELWLPTCVDTGRFFFPPRARSPFTGGAVSWAQVSGRAQLASFVINHRPAPGYEDETPYVIALVELAEGPRLASNLIGVEADPTAIWIGMPLQVTFEDRGTITVPQFTPAAA
jgi:uncharacterized OB-fold protein